MATNILLLGKDGQVGWQLQRSLAPLGTVSALGRNECNLADPDAVRRAVREHAPALIVNAAAYTAVDKAESEADLAHAINAVAPGVLAEEAKRSAAMLVHYSTDYVFDGHQASPYVEDDATNPQSVYGRSKLAGEQAVLAAGCRALIFRTSWVFGARGQNFVKTILRLAAEREALSVVDDQIGQPSPAAMISDVTGLVLAARRSGPQANAPEAQIYHLAGQGALSWNGFARAIVEQARRTPGFDLKLLPENIAAIPTSGYPLPAARPPNSRLDCHKLENDFGIELPDWRPYLARMLQLLALKKANGY
jgi:dTDP-4-dehydrorhamnose reductase